MKKIEERAEDEIWFDLLQYLLIKVLKDPSSLLSGKREWGASQKEPVPFFLSEGCQMWQHTCPTFPGTCVLLLEWGMFPMGSDDK